MVKVSYNILHCVCVFLCRSRPFVCVAAVFIVVSINPFCKAGSSSEKSLISLEGIKGEVELAASVQKNKQIGTNESRKSTATSFTERLNLKTRGNVYHPKLLSFSGSVGIGLLQHDFSSSQGDLRTSGTLYEYDFSADLLKAKPYPINFYTSKSENLIPRQFQSTLLTENEASGISLALHFDQWPMNFQYSTTSVLEESVGSSGSSFSSDYTNRVEDRFRYDTSHSFNSNSRLTFNFERIDRTSESSRFSTNRVQDAYQLNHSLSFGDFNQHMLSSSLSYNETTGGSTSRDNLRLDEKLHLRHNKDFSTNYLFRFTESNNTSGKNTNLQCEANFTHQLYKSLTTTGGFEFNNSKTGSISETQRHKGSLGLSYRKSNPFGVFSASYYGSLSQNRQTGGNAVSAVVAESHFATSSPVVLNRRNIDISTIRVEDEFGNPYDEGIDYLIVETNGQVQLEILLVGAPAPVFTQLDGTEEFFVDYNYFIEPEQQDERLTQRFYARQDFGFGLGVFYEHSRQDQDITSNVTLITPDESRRNSYGFDYRKGRFSLFGKYETLDSTQVISETKRLRARYSFDLSPNTVLNIHGMKEIYNYSFPDSRENTLLRLGSQLTTRFNSKLSGSTTLDYIDQEYSGSIRTTGLQLRSNLNYKYRQFFLTAGVDYNMLENNNSENDSLFLYCRIKRYF